MSVYSYLSSMFHHIHSRHLSLNVRDSRRSAKKARVSAFYSAKIVPEGSLTKRERSALLFREKLAASLPADLRQAFVRDPQRALGELEQAHKLASPQKQLRYVPLFEVFTNVPYLEAEALKDCADCYDDAVTSSGNFREDAAKAELDYLRRLLKVSDRAARGDLNEISFEIALISLIRFRACGDPCADVREFAHRTITSEDEELLKELLESACRWVSKNFGRAHMSEALAESLLLVAILSGSRSSILRAKTLLSQLLPAKHDVFESYAIRLKDASAAIHVRFPDLDF